MGVDDCILCNAPLDEEEKQIGFCASCEVKMLGVIQDEAMKEGEAN